MLKQFNLELLAFRDPQESEEGWIDIETQEEINAISESITNNGKVWVENGKIRCSGKAPSEFHTFNLKTKLFEISSERTATLLAERKAKILIEVAKKTDDFKAQYLVGYSQAEIDSFYRQEKEALAWRADNSAQTPMLTQIAKVRGVPFEILVSKVLEKSDQFAVAIGMIIGKRQAFEDRLVQANTLEELKQLELEVTQWQAS